MSERILSVGGNKASRPIEDFMIGIVGTEYYVGPNAVGAGDDGRSGRSKETSLATTEAAIAKATASKNDIIYLLPGHAETVATAGAISLDKIGLRVVNLGLGALAATFTFSAVDATITMTAASCSIEGYPIFKPSIDSVVSPLVVSAADCKADIYLQDASAEIECVRAVLTTAAAKRVNIKVRHRGFILGDACVNSVRLVGADTAKVDVDFYGKTVTDGASHGIVEFHTMACHDVEVKGNFYNSGITDLSKNVVDTVTGSIWSVSGFDGAAGGGFSGGSGQTIAGDDVSTLSAKVDTLNTADQLDLDAILADTTTIGDATLPVAPVAGSLARFVASGGTALGTQLPDSKSLYDMVRAYGNGYLVSKTYADLTGYDTLAAFTVTGDVMARIVGVVGAAAITSTSGTTTLAVGTTELATGIIAASTVDNTQFAATDVWVDSSPANDVEIMASAAWHIIGGGADIILTRSADDLTAGALALYCFWSPLSSDGNVVVA